MNRSIRLLGAALGGLTGLALARPAGMLVASPDGEFRLTGSGALLLAPWLIAWVVVGFALLPYLTVVPATKLFRAVQNISTAEFVTAVIGLLLVVSVVIPTLARRVKEAFDRTQGGRRLPTGSVGGPGEVVSP